MFGFQRMAISLGRLDARAKASSSAALSATTLNGEGLQHQDGQSLLNAIAFPTVRATTRLMPTKLR